ncbi:hypothetical protein CDD83_11016 [Cordyceps sp. RAO-2017]|nr:hypothetical protein CDD83_11016 [Cordyceps sp. RAO-2017]
MARFWLLGLEFTIAAAGVLLFTYSVIERPLAWKQGRPSACTSNQCLIAAPSDVSLTQRLEKACHERFHFEEGGCADSKSSPRSMVSSLVISVLALLICLTRAILLRLNYLSLYADMMYDVVPLTLWIISAARQFSDAGGTLAHSHELSAHLAGLLAKDDDGLRARKACCLAVAGLVLALLAVALYCTRLLVSLREAVGGCHRTCRLDEKSWDYEHGKELIANAEWQPDARKTLYEQSLSPVLAFFPSTPK